MSILTIDVGLKNLALCIMNCENKKDYETYKIQLWEVYNTLESEEYKCMSYMKNGKQCLKKCGYRYIDDKNELVYVCKPHFPKNIKITNKNIYKQKRVDDYLLQDIATIIIRKLNELFTQHYDMFQNICKVLIELQPKVNNKMKLISHIIYGKFVEYYMENKNVSIRFIRASQKLKAYKGPIIKCELKGAYAKRKYLSIKYTEWFLDNVFEKEESKHWKTVFFKHNKKDDLGDVFLMCINALK
jgi:hypothetical protein